MSMSSARTSSSFAELTGAAKLEDVTKLMDKLASDLQHISLLPHQRDQVLEQVKVYGRDPTNADPIFTRQGIETLTRHAFNSPSRKTSQNALRVLANAMLLKEDTRQIFLDLGYEQKACNMLKNDSRDDEFLVGRILFLTTYVPTVDIEKFIDEYHAAENICLNISRHTNQYTTKQKKIREINPMEDMALIETLKLLFNFAYHCPQRSESFVPALPHILLLLVNRPISPSKPLDPPISTLVNSLLNIVEHDNTATDLFPKSGPNTNVDRLLEILDKSIKVYKDDDLEHLVSPLLTLLNKIYPFAPREAQARCQEQLLPSNEDRQQPLGKAESLSSRLLRLLSNPVTPKVRDIVSALLFQLSDSDAKNFVHNVGYGFASGFLFSHGMQVPETALEAWSTESNASNTTARHESWDSKPGINPITGQYLTQEKKVEEEIEMTQEEKEREAERLFVLFERLRATGVVKVQNPVETAINEGRFEELDDDADSK